jgi:hypothetical protein
MGGFWWCHVAQGCGARGGVLHSVGASAKGLPRSTHGPLYLLCCCGTAHAAGRTRPPAT